MELLWSIDHGAEFSQVDQPEARDPEDPNRPAGRSPVPPPASRMFQRSCATDEMYTSEQQPVYRNENSHHPTNPNVSFKCLR